MTTAYEIALWNHVRPMIRKAVGERNWQTWLQSLRVERVSDNVVVLSVPNRSVQSWTERHYRSAILICWRSVLPEIEEVRIERPRGIASINPVIAEPTSTPAPIDIVETIPGGIVCNAALGRVGAGVAGFEVRYRLRPNVDDLDGLSPVQRIQRVVARHFNVTRLDLLSARRTRDVVFPRQVAMYLAKTLTLRSLPFIGRHFGHRDHTTVLHAVRKLTARLTWDDDLVATIRALTDEIQQGSYSHASFNGACHHRDEGDHPYAEVARCDG